MALYHFDSLQSLANHIRERAAQLDKYVDRQRAKGASARAIRETEIERNAWLTVAELVKDSVIDTTLFQGE